MGRDGWQWPRVGMAGSGHGQGWLAVATSDKNKSYVLLVFFFFGLSYFIFNLQTNGLEKFGRPLQKMNVTIVKGEI